MVKNIFDNSVTIEIAGIHIFEQKKMREMLRV